MLLGIAQGYMFFFCKTLMLFKTKPYGLFFKKSILETITVFRDKFVGYRCTQRYHIGLILIFGISF